MNILWRVKENIICKSVCLLTISILLAACGSSSVSNPPAMADYGDAPDDGPTGYPAPFAQTGQFPSLFGSGGAHIIDVSAASLGITNTEESDAAVVNLDIDDSLTNFYTTLTSIPPPTTMSVNVTGTETGAYFFNALIDLNMDGKWGGATGANGETEWVVQNQPVTVTAGVVTPVTSPPFAFTNGLFVPDRAWMRVALTKEQVSQDWDGTGQFSKGEIEDYPIMPPIVDGKEIPLVQADCRGPYSFGDNIEVTVTCTVTNLRAVAGTFTYSVEHRPNGGTVTIPSCQSTGPIAIGAAAKPGELPNPNPAAKVDITCIAKKGNTPDSWTFIAKVVDPVFVGDPNEPQGGQDEAATALIPFDSDEVLPFSDPGFRFLIGISAGVLQKNQGPNATQEFSATVGASDGSFTESEEREFDAILTIVTDAINNPENPVFVQKDEFPVDPVTGKVEGEITVSALGAYRSMVTDIRSTNGATYNSELNQNQPFFDFSNLEAPPGEIPVSVGSFTSDFIHTGVTSDLRLFLELTNKVNGTITTRTTKENDTFEQFDTFILNPPGFIDDGRIEITSFGRYNTELFSHELEDPAFPEPAFSDEFESGASIWTNVSP